MRHVALALLCLAAFASAPAAQSTPLTTELAWSGYVKPLQLTSAPGDAARIFIVEQNQADIHVIVDGIKIAAPFLDLTGLVTTGGNEQGLLGLAFHPDYASNGQLYVNYTGGGGTKIVRYLRNPADFNLALPGSAQMVIEYSQPQSNHNGGGLAFGPNGYMWIGTGDGGNFNDTGTGHVAGGNAQSGTTLLGKMLRIDVDGDDFGADPNRNYAIPDDNPFVNDSSVLDEIIHFGMRNPWRFDFDRMTGDLLIGDVGQNAREEVDYLGRADVDAATFINWGWRCMEGAICTGLSGCACPSPTLTGPIAGYTHGVGQSLTGGYVYRGDAIPDLAGTYFYADYQASKFFSIRYDGVTLSEVKMRTDELDPPGSLAINRPAAFGEDAAGEMYICDLLHGEIFRIVPDGPFRGLGNALAGVNGDPVLYGTGSVGLGEPGSLHVRSAVPSSLAVAFASLTNNPVPFFGGTLVPGLPLVLSLNVFTDPSGAINLGWADLGSNPSGLEIFIQFGFDDPGAVFGVSLSNAISVTIP
jgi:glucose/arabinose dehydrogenase